MNTNSRVTPHGGELVDLLVDDERAGLLKDIVLNLPDITLNERQMCDLELMATGAFSPLKGFMTRSDYESVLDRMRLQNDILWPIPICLDVDEVLARSLEAGQSVALRDPEGYLLAVARRILGERIPIVCSYDLHGILTASERAGLQRFLFQPDPDLSAPEWSVISDLCGKRWHPSRDGYWPSDSSRPDAFSR